MPIQNWVEIIQTAAYYGASTLKENIFDPKLSCVSTPELRLSSEEGAHAKSTTKENK